MRAVAASPCATPTWKRGRSLLLMERDGAAIAFLARQMAYHHVAQGEFAGEPYLISF